MREPHLEQRGRGWLEAEMRLVRPDVVVCLGGVAARSLLGRTFRTTEHRGRPLDGAPWARQLVVTHHPGYPLRASDPTIREELVADLRLAASLVR